MRYKNWDLPLSDSHLSSRFLASLLASLYRDPNWTGPKETNGSHSPAPSLSYPHKFTATRDQHLVSFTPLTNLKPTPKQKPSSASVSQPSISIMNVLDSNLEALAFNYLSFGLFTVVNNLWTWIAVLTAAVSFWRLRPRAAATSAISSSALKFRSQPAISGLSLNGSSPVPEITQSNSAAKKVEPPCFVPALAKFGDSTVQLTKGSKFAVYFEDSDVESDLTATSSLTPEKDETEESGSDEVAAASWWEDVLTLRTGEMSWYRYQDLTELNGNVVRLWDDYSRIVGETASSSAKPKRRVVW
nr:uncharacterized protein LOC103400907 [Malus domestica]